MSNTVVEPSGDLIAKVTCLKCNGDGKEGAKLPNTKRHCGRCGGSGKEVVEFEFNMKFLVVLQRVLKGISG